MTKGIYIFFEEYGRMGTLEGVFVADSEDVRKIIGEEVYFGEVLGKHSDIVLEIKKGHFTLKSEDQEFIAVFEQLCLEVGFNPFNYREGIE